MGKDKVRWCLSRNEEGENENGSAISN